MKALIVANGDAPGAEFLQGLAAQHDLVICADGGANAAIAAGIMPHIVCGDFNSVVPTARAALPGAEFVSLPDQSLMTDLEKALHLAMARGATEVTIAGGWGGRIDHALGVLMVLVRYHQQIDLRLAGEGFDLFVISDGGKALATQAGDIISLLSLNDTARLTIAHVEWPLTDETLAIGTRGISNVALGDRVEVSVRGGPVILCRLDHQLGL